MLLQARTPPLGQVDAAHLITFIIALLHLLLCESVPNRRAEEGTSTSQVPGHKRVHQVHNLLRESANKAGFSSHSPVLEPPRHLEYMTARIRSRGGVVRQSDMGVALRCRLGATALERCTSAPYCTIRPCSTHVLRH